jgi:hypothetical protein
VLSDFGIDQFAPMRLEARKRPFLVGTYKPTVTGYIGGENGGQPAFDAFRGQSGTPRPQGRNRLSALEPILTVNEWSSIPLVRQPVSLPAALHACGACDQGVRAT